MERQNFNQVLRDAIQDHARLEIEAIRGILMNSDAVHCDVDSYEPTYYCDNTVYHVPNGYCVQIDYNKLAKAIYDAGYRR